METTAPETRAIGFAGWSGAGKTTLIARLLPALVARGLRVSTIKHAHHGFDVDKPGKDSWVHRKAGAQEVLVASSRRWVLMHELGTEEAEPGLGELLRRLSPCDLVLVEGFKRDPLPKIEIVRAESGTPPLYPGDPTIVAVASDRSLPGLAIPVVDLGDLDAVTALVLGRAEPVAAVLGRLGRAGG
ncbi:MAG TPA: molybdopterin-guanine dinucleotide biosynthesis protein B [Hyphomicrobiales bacterium]|nr:molybdopterin-guanine dinucleotide biosynthesis protein B [Hyphomicrobiales bacterium]